ncbi:chromosome partitioning protein ParA, partial [Candidatus Sumerlaeota bacterium]|nr:chromosome partitioning protein ParA [Candidatus Sumerlaeota bacterium]
PPHEPGLLPRWLAGQGVNIVLTGGMGWRAIEMFQERGIDVVTGVTGGTPEQVILAHLSGTLSVTDNTCDH